MLSYRLDYRGLAVINSWCGETSITFFNKVKMYDYLLNNVIVVPLQYIFANITTIDQLYYPK